MDKGELLSFIDLVAIKRQRTLRAFWISRGTDLSAEEDNSVTEVGTFFRRQNGTKLLFYLFGVRSLGKSQSTANPDAVGVAYHAAIHLIQISQEQIGGLSAYTGEFCEFFKIVKFKVRYIAT